MSKNSAVNWADSSFTWWEGCTKASAGCKFCYAARRDERNLYGDGSHWGPGAPRKSMSDSYWRGPLSWDKEAAAKGTRPIVLCCELADWCDDDPGVPKEQRLRGWQLVRQTPNLMWCLLTKRTQNLGRFIPTDWREGWDNVMLGATIDCRANLGRIDDLRSVPARHRYLSVEPLLDDLGEVDFTGIDWVIVGGESGSEARPFHAEWAESIMRQCREQGVPFWCKQLGGNAWHLSSQLDLMDMDKNGNERHSINGEDWNRWPEALRHLKVRQKPVFDAVDGFDDVVEIRQHEQDMATVEAKLAKLARCLDGNAAISEQEARKQYIACERRLFMTTLERGKILAAFREVYGPKRKWLEFLAIIEVPRSTAHRLISRCEMSQNETCATAETALVLLDGVRCQPKGRKQPTTGDKIDKLARQIAELPTAEQIKAAEDLIRVARAIQQRVNLQARAA